jgi:hypothetical protein
LDAQGSADLIPTAGPDAAADQGPAIKAVWEPSAAGRPGERPGGRRGAPEGRASARRSGSRQKRSGRRRGVIFAGTAAVVLVGVVVADLNSRGPGPQKGAATTVLPMVSDSATPSQQAQAANLTQTADPSRSASRSPSSSPSPSRSAAPSLTPGAPTSTGASSGAASPTATRTTPKSNPTTCFLIFCS